MMPVSSPAWSTRIIGLHQAKAFLEVFGEMVQQVFIWGFTQHCFVDLGRKSPQ